jgi:hypothetical protein
MRRLSRKLPDKIAAPNVRMNSGTAKVRNARDIEAPLELRNSRTRAPLGGRSHLLRFQWITLENSKLRCVSRSKVLFSPSF